MSLVEINCPKCGNKISPKSGISKSTFSYTDCLRQCEKCEIGFSNAKNNPTVIYKNHIENINEVLRTNLDVSLNNSLNVMNRKNKQIKFGFSTSEDALTWSFFKYFVDNNRFEDLLNLLNIKSNETIYDVYLWGTKINSSSNEIGIIEKFIEVSDLFQEKSNKRTEPDVILKLSDRLVFIEVKYLSKNEIIMDNDKFQKYLIPDVDKEELFESGHYELFRNWAFASKMSNGDNFELINLGYEKLFYDQNKAKLSLSIKWHIFAN